TGLFKMAVPATYGGGEVDPRTMFAAIEAVAAADGSAGWCVMIGATSGLAAAWFDVAAASDAFGPHDAIAGGVLAPRGRAVPVEGGLAVDGRWPFGSGCEHSTWLAGGCLVGDDRVPRVVLFPQAAAQIIDTWTVAGLRGTGSHDF